MITIISGTNRSGSNTKKIALEYQRILEEKGIDVKLFSLEGVNVMQNDAAFRQIEEDIIIPTNTFIFIVPEYNGSFPGVLKMLFDTGASHGIWFRKKALLTGVATGRAGNLRGMDHLADILNYVKITVHPNRLPISGVDKLLSPEGKLVDASTRNAIKQQLEEFLEWGGEFRVKG